MSINAVYRSSDPTVLTAWDTWTAAVASHRDDLIVFADKYDLPHTFRGSDRYVHGWVLANDDDLIPAGFRIAADSGLVVPSKRSALGKQAAAEMDALNKRRNRQERPALPGIQQSFFTGHHMWTAGIRRVGDQVTVIFGTDVENVDTRDGDRPMNIDKAIWSRVPLSVYFAEVEAEDAAVSA